jgi:hypothetical protein
LQKRWQFLVIPKSRLRIWRGLILFRNQDGQGVRARVKFAFRLAANVAQAFGHDAQALAKPASLKIAQPFMAGFMIWKCSKSRQGRKKWSIVPDGTLKFGSCCSRP